MSTVQSNPTSMYGKETLTNFLMHYGVLGMKWGRRKQRSSNPRSTSTKSKSQTSNTTAKQPSVKKSNTLSNNPQNQKLTTKQLQEKVSRLMLEKQLAQLMAPTPTPQAPKPQSWQKRLASSLPEKMATAAVDVSISVGKKYLEQVLKVNIDKKIDPSFQIGKLKNESK